MIIVVLLSILSFGELAEMGQSLPTSVRSHQSCSSTLQEISSSEEKRRFFLSARKGQCIEQIRGSLSNLAGKNDFDSAQEAQGVFQSMYSGLGLSVHRSAHACSQINDQEEAKYLVAKQYYSTLRLENYQKQVALQLKSFNNLLEDNYKMIRVLLLLILVESL